MYLHHSLSPREFPLQGFHLLNMGLSLFLSVLLYIPGIETLVLFSISPQPGDKNLAQSAQMYHYQHQKQQMLSMDK